MKDEVVINGHVEFKTLGQRFGEVIDFNCKGVQHLPRIIRDDLRPWLLRHLELELGVTIPRIRAIEVESAPSDFSFTGHLGFCVDQRHSAIASQQNLDVLRQSQASIVMANPGGSFGDQCRTAFRNLHAIWPEQLMKPRPNRRHVRHAARRQTQRDRGRRQPGAIKQSRNACEPTVQKDSKQSFKLGPRQRIRDKFFEHHAKCFHHRPFIWHIWDGLKDGFGALVNYHKLDAKNLDRLIHTYLGEWISQQEAGVRDQMDGAAPRLAAALDLKSRLQKIVVGEPPYDIFVRWKPLDQQPIGWNPDLNDGVRVNIRPFMTAEVLRHYKKPKLNITWDKDRGKDVESAPWFKVFKGERINDHHLTLEEKKAAREKQR